MIKRVFDWFSKSDNPKKLRMFCFFAIILAEFIFPWQSSQYSWDRIPGFYAIFGFLSCAAMIIVSRLLGQFWLKKNENYYDR